MYDKLEEIGSKPKPFQHYTADELWTDEHTSEKMLKYHLNEDIDVSSRRGEFIDRSVEWIASRFGIGNGSTIADFGCGPGLYTIRLARKGADVTGIDFSIRSIEYARKAASEECLSIDYINENYLEFESDSRFDLITMIMCDFCALGPQQRKKILCKFRDLLSPKGHILLDVYSLEAFRKREESATFQKNLLDGFWSPDDYYGFLNVFKYEEEKVVLDKYTIIEPERKRTIYNWLKYFSMEDLRKEFEECGLGIVDKYSDVAGDEFDPTSDEFAVVAMKKEE